MGLGEYFSSLGITENTSWGPDGYSNVYTKLALVQLGFLGEAQFNDYDAVRDAFTMYNLSELKQQAVAASTAGVVKMGQSLPYTWFTIKRDAPLDHSQSFSIGNQTTLFNKQLGYIFGFRYSASKLYDNNGTFGRTELPDNIVTNIDTIEIYNYFGSTVNSIETNNWSFLLGTSLKLNSNHSVSFLFMPNVIGVNRARIDSTTTLKTGSPATFRTQSQYYESRSQMVFQINSEHYFPLIKMKAGLNISYTDGESNTPDYRQLHYYEDGQTITGLRAGYALSDTDFRLFRNLSEDLIDFQFFAEIPIYEKPGLPRKLKFGGAWFSLLRESDQHEYWLPPPAIEEPFGAGGVNDYLGIDKFGLVDGNIKRYYWQLAGPEMNTIGFHKKQAMYLCTDYSVSESIRVAAGIRFENHHLHTDIRSFYDRQLAEDDYRRWDELINDFVKPGLLDRLFLFPSASLIYTLNENEASPVNVRVNFSKTSVTPSLRELTPYQVFDYLLLGMVTGNSRLKSVDIYNWDLRAEAFGNNGNNISLSVFYKDFKNHIELIRRVKDQVYYSWENADKSNAKGIEIEGKIGIIKNLSLRGNLTLISSETRVNGDKISRNMFGQSPYILNASLSYDSDKHGISSALSYNINGKKLVITGNLNSPDIYELPRNMIDARISKSLGKHFNISLKVRDILNTSQVRAFNYTAGFVDFDHYTYGTSYVLSLAYTLN